MSDPSLPTDAPGLSAVTDRPKYRRRLRNYVLLERFQARLVLSNLVLSICFVFVLTVGILGPLVFDVLSGGSGDLVRSESAVVLLALHNSVWPILVLAPVALTLALLVLSHRIAGPLYRIRVSLKSITEGDWPTNIRLRPKDFLHEEADIVNNMVSSVRTQFKDLLERQLALGAELESLSSKACSPSGIDRASLVSELGSLGKRCSELESRLSELLGREADAQVVSSTQSRRKAA